MAVTAYLDNTVIQLLPDVMFQLSINVHGSCPRAFSPFTAGFLPGSLSGLVDDDWRQFVIGSTQFYSTWVPDVHYINNLRLDDIYEVYDNEVWNERLIYHAGDCANVITLRNSIGTAITFIPQVQSTLFVYTSRPSPLSVNQVWTTLPCANTTWIPKYDINGTVFWLTWPRNMIQVGQWMLGASVPSLSVWQIGKTRVPSSVLQVKKSQGRAKSIIDSFGMDASDMDKSSTVSDIIIENLN